MIAPIATDGGAGAAPAEPNGLFIPKTPKEFAKGLIDRFRGKAAEPHSFVVQLERQADLSKIAEMPRGIERRQAAWDALRGVAEASRNEFAPKLDKWTDAGLVSEWRHSALGNTIEILSPPEKAADFAKALAKTDGIAIWEEFSPTPAKPPAPAPKKPPSITEQTLERHQDAGPKDASDFESRYNQAWHLWQTGVRDLRDQGFTGKGVTVGIVDTGVDIDHPNLRHALKSGPKEKVWMPPQTDALNAHKRYAKAELPTDFGSHGTHVAGIVAGHQTGDLKTGMAPDAKLMVASIFDPANPSVIGAFEWMLAPGDGDFTSPTRDAAAGADLINNSWGFVGPDGERYGRLLKRPIQQLSDAGVIPVFAAGNSGPGFGTILEPGLSQDVITVGATERDGTIASFSSRDKYYRAESRLRPDVAAPGHPIMSSIPDGEADEQLVMAGTLGWILGDAVPGARDNGPVKGTDGAIWKLSGTSMASPAVAGALATILQAYPQLDTEDLKQILRDTAQDMGRAGAEPMYGWGRMDLPSAMQAAAKVAREKYGVSIDKPYVPTDAAKFPVSDVTPEPHDPKRKKAAG